MRGINFLFLKNQNKIILASNPSFSDNARAFFKYIMEKDKCNKYKFVWVIDKGFKPREDYDRVKFVYKDSMLSKNWWKYLYHLYTSKYLISTHSYFSEANPWVQTSVCTWHGTMLKRICKLNEREKSQPVKSQFRWFLSPSTFYDNIVTRSFGVSRKKVLTCGYPRNDLLFEKTDILDKLGIKKGENKIIAYLPTFRIPKGGGYQDCAENKRNYILDLEDKDWLTSMNEKLNAIHIKLVVKLHPYDSVQYAEKKLSNIFIIPHTVLAEKDCQLYHLLHYADALITDYSSVYCDYLILDRPIAFAVNDMAEYGSKRGFVFDNPLEFLPGSIIENECDMLSFIEEISKGVDSSKDKRQKLHYVYNDFMDNNNSNRLAEAIRLDL